MPKQQPWIKVAGRTVLAMTCWSCGQLRQGTSYGRFPRYAGGPAYLDRRCNDTCRWRTMAASRGR